jgi:hypothetical protein
MLAKLRALCGCQVVVAGLFILMFILSAVGCGTSSLGSYRAALQDSNGPKFNAHDLRIEHNLFNSKYQKGKEDWEED